MRIGLPLPQPLLPGRVVRRVNRFAVEVIVGDSIRYAHLPNSGRMKELLVPGASVRIHPTERGKTWGTVLLVRHQGRWVGVDSHIPNRLWEAVLRAGGLPPIEGVRSWEREIQLGGERIDFRVRAADGFWFVETKSCNRVERGIALFPDAPTARGARHLRALARAARHGMHAAVIWFVQRDDARLLRLDAHADPDFAEAGREAQRAGVKFWAYLCSLTLRRITIESAIPVEIPSCLC
ncbi:MAG: DNA/RNA nuclease SfsA [Blastocatellia bacterium]|nr:DNA/RNA nuclease SfsA [Blastocatellia bacterium]